MMAAAVRRSALAIGVLGVVLAVAGAPASGQALYVANSGSENVSVIDTASNQVVDTVPVGGPTLGIAFAPGGTTGFVAGGPSLGLNVLDALSGTFTGSIGLEQIPSGIAIAPGGQIAYVTSPYTYDATEVNLTTGAMVGPPFPVGGGGGVPLAITPDGTKAYTTDGTNNNNTISVVDLETRKIVKTIPSGASVPWRVVLSADGRTAYIDSQSTRAIVVLDTASDEITQTIPIEGGGEEAMGALGFMALSPDGKTLYFGRPLKGTVETLDTRTNQVVGAPISVGRFPAGIVVTPDGRTVYVANSQTGAVIAIDAATRRVVGKPIPVGKEPREIAIGSSPLSSLAISIVNSRSGIQRGRAPMGIFCNGAYGAQCRGRINLSLFVRSRAHPRRTKTLAFGHRAYRVTAGSSAYFPVPLTRHGRRLVNRFGHLRVRVTASLQEGDPTGHKVVLVAPR